MYLAKDLDFKRVHKNDPIVNNLLTSLKVGELEDINIYDIDRRVLLDELMKVRRMIVVYYSISDVLECMTPSLIIKKQIDFFT